MELVEKVKIYLTHLFRYDSLVFGEIREETWDKVHELFKEYYSKDEIKEIFKECVVLWKPTEKLDKSTKLFLKYRKNTVKHLN